MSSKSFSKYLSEIGEIPLLTREGEAELGRLVQIGLRSEATVMEQNASEEARSAIDSGCEHPIETVIKSEEVRLARMAVLLNQRGHGVNRKRVQRLLGVMGLEAIYPRRHLSQPGQGQELFPYLLKDLQVSGPNQVWCSDITYILLAYGFMYLVAVMDWWSRYVLASELSNPLEAEFCIRAWERALAHAGATLLISNTDQASQFTSPGFIDAVQPAGVEVSMDGRGRWMDNRFIERLWRSVKYEDVYLRDYGDGLSAGRGLGRWFEDYNELRPHQALGNATPAQWYRSAESYGARPAPWAALRARPERNDTGSGWAKRRMCELNEEGEEAARRNAGLNEQSLSKLRENGMSDDREGRARQFPGAGHG